MCNGNGVEDCCHGHEGQPEDKPAEQGGQMMTLRELIAKYAAGLIAPGIVWDELDDDFKAACFDSAQELLTAITEAGLQITPVEPTGEMYKVVYDPNMNIPRLSQNQAGKVYKAMNAAYVEEVDDA
tara:strand:+ start:75 stop:452 length:378 start_codon:yes stop_codon:yes gene_type:complete